MNLLTRFHTACLILLPVSVHSAAPVKPADIHPERELLITHPSVVDSEEAKYPGAWSFGKLMEELVGKEKAPETTRQWLECYYWDTLPGSPRPLPTLTDSVLEAMTIQMRGARVLAKAGEDLRIPGRADIARKVILPWMGCDGHDPAKGEPWKPNLANAPFRLLAIVNRMDLAASQSIDFERQLENRWKLAGREKDFARLRAIMTNVPPVSNRALPRSRGGYGCAFTNLMPPDAGEGRLIFGAVDTDGRPLAGGWTVIFEYKLTTARAPAPFASQKNEVANATAARGWAEAWHRLGTLELADHRYNEALKDLTMRFTNGPVERETPNGVQMVGDPAPLGQVRSSEAAFGSSREFRQFQLTGDTLVPALLPMTPSPNFMRDTREGGRFLSSFLQAIQPFILAGVHSLPDKTSIFGNERSLIGGHAVIPAGDAEFHWEPSPRISREARRVFSINTCNGCHAADTGCADGLHIHPRAAGESAKLSGFLRMDGKPNRFQDPGIKTSFVQQHEMEDRAAILAALLQPKESRRLDALEDILRERMRRGH